MVEVTVEALGVAATKAIAQVVEPVAIAKSALVEVRPSAILLEVTAFVVVSVAAMGVPVVTAVFPATEVSVHPAALAGFGLASLHARKPSVMGVQPVVDGGELARMRSSLASMAAGSGGAPDMMVDAPGKEPDTKLLWNGYG
jgi:hypothetical protein